MKMINTVALILLAVAAGCAYPEHYATTGDAAVASPTYTKTTTTTYRHQQPGPSAAEMQRQADDNLAAIVRGQFNRYGDLNTVAPNIGVTAQSGTVTLTGSVPSQRERAMIDAMVRNTAGVVAVNNYLQVQQPYSSTGRAAEPPRVYSNAGENVDLHVLGLNESDRALGQQILNRLHTDPAWDSSFANVNIYVENGFVTVRGVVENEGQKQRIVAAVERAAGVEVRNELHARPVVR